MSVSVRYTTSFGVSGAGFSPFTATQTLATTPLAGDLLVAILNFTQTAGTTPPNAPLGMTVSDSAGNTWVQIPGSFLTDGNCYGSTQVAAMKVYVCYSAKAVATSLTVTMSWGSALVSGAVFTVNYVDFTGISASQYDAIGTLMTLSASTNSPSISINAPVASLIIGFFVQGNRGATSPWTPASGFTFIINSPANVRGTEYKDFTSGNVTVGITNPNSVAHWLGIAMAFPEQPISGLTFVNIS